MATNLSQATETIRHCELCGEEVVLYYAGEDVTSLKFCCRAHKTEYHGIFPISQSRRNVLEHLAGQENGEGKLPSTNTVYMMSNLNKNRAVPMIRCIDPDNLRQHRTFQLTEFGKKVLDKISEID